MSQEPHGDPPNHPRTGKAAGPEPERRFSGGAFAGGFFTGGTGLFVVYFLTFMSSSSGSTSGVPHAVPAFLPIGIYLVVAIVLAVRRSTLSFGTGLLVGLGVWVLLGGGLCVSTIAQYGGSSL